MNEEMRKQEEQEDKEFKEQYGISFYDLWAEDIRREDEEEERKEQEMIK